jgi:hypothetical protein
VIAIEGRLVMTGSFARYLCLSVDAQGYGRAPDRGQAAIQDALLEVLTAAAAAAGVDRGGWHRQGKGDEELALVPASGPDAQARVIDGFVGELAAALLRRNCAVPAGRALRLRLAIDGGLAARSSNGFAGRPVVTVSRLVGCRPLRQALAVAPDAGLGVILSRQVYGELVLGGHTRARPDDFRRVAVREKELDDAAWLRVPGVNVHGLRLGPAGMEPPGDGGEPDAGGPARFGSSNGLGGQVVVNEFRAAVDASHGVIGIRNDR